MGRLNNMKILFVFLILFISQYTYAQQCERQGKNLWYDPQTGTQFNEDRNGNKTPEFLARCTEKKPASVKIVDNGCSACWDKHGTGPVGRGVCGNQRKCDTPSIFNGSVNFASTLAPCGNQYVCSEETQLCEYICEEDFFYNFGSGLCERECSSNQVLISNSCQTCTDGKIPNEARNRCICPTGQEERNGICVALNNPCLLSHGPEYRPYSPYSDFDCKIPTLKTSIMSPCLGNNCYRADLTTMNQVTSFSVTAENVGCERVNGQDNAVFKINHERSSVRSYKHREMNFPVYAVCADASGSGAVYPTLMGSVPMYMADSNNYIKVPSTNKCYKYKLFVLDGYSIQTIGDFDLPYQTCDECAPGLVKIGTECTCPVGKKVGVSGTCEDAMDCGTAANFNAGKCACSEPYRYSSINGTKYSCSNPPTYSRFSDLGGISRGNKTQVSVTATSCTNGVANFAWSASNSSTYPVNMYYFCSGKTYLELYPDPQPGEYSFYGFGGGLGTRVAGSSSGSGTFSVPIDGTCYEYIMAAVDTWTWMGETTFSVQYKCGQ